MITVSLCPTDLSCFSLQCLRPSGCCEGLVQIVEGMAEGTSVRTWGKLKWGSLKSSESIGLCQGRMERSWAGREWLGVGKMKGKCPKFGLLFLHTCYAPISHFPPPPLPHSFFLSWGNHPASHFFCEEGIPSLVGCIPLWQDTWIHKTTCPRMQRASFRIIRKVIFLLQWGQSGWWGGTQTNPPVRRPLLPVKSVLASTGKKRLVSPAAGCLYDCFFPQLCFFELLFLCSVIE